MTPPEIRPGTDEGRERGFCPDKARFSPPATISVAPSNITQESETATDSTYHWLGMDEGQ